MKLGSLLGQPAEVAQVFALRKAKKKDKSFEPQE
jgi:hypothetical protein